MKNFNGIILCLSLLALMGCEKHKNALPDFSNTLPMFIQISNNKGSLTVNASRPYSFVLTTGYGFQEDITINYEIKGLATTQGNIVLPKATRSVTLMLTAPATPQTMTFSLLTTSSPKLSVGKLSPASEKVTITVK